MRSLLKWSPNKINEKESTRDPAVEVPRMQSSARCANRQGFSGRAETVSVWGASISVLAVALCNSKTTKRMQMSGCVKKTVD